MSICNRCRIDKTADQFNPRGKGQQPYCKPCQSAYAAEHYQKNKPSYYKRNNETRRRVRRAINKLKNVPCADCGGHFHPVAMDFDHPEENKLFDIATMVGRLSMERVIAEIQKCEIVCSNCHRVRTYNRIHQKTGHEI